MKANPPQILVAGIDEAGRGPLAGPVVAAAVVLDPQNEIEGLADSKQLDEAQREALFTEIRKGALAWASATVEAGRIDDINILQATLLAMRRAFGHVEKKMGLPVARALVDGNRLPPLPARVQGEAIVKGDTFVPEIMAASIVAKVTRDRRMRREAKRFPDYGFESHKGYGTPSHLRALEKWGPCHLHRRSFSPVARAAANFQS